MLGIFLLVAQSPAAMIATSSVAKSQAELEGVLHAMAGRSNYSALETESPDAICAQFTFSNSTVSTTASVNGMLCSSAPLPQSVSANLSIALVGRYIEVYAWSTAKG
jgi:hypothetical protein